MYASAIEPSGHARLRTYDFRVPKYLWNKVMLLRLYDFH